MRRGTSPQGLCGGLGASFSPLFGAATRTSTVIATSTDVRRGDPGASANVAASHCAARQRRRPAEPTRLPVTSSRTCARRRTRSGIHSDLPTVLGRNPVLGCAARAPQRDSKADALAVQGHWLGRHFRVNELRKPCHVSRSGSPDQSSHHSVGMSSDCCDITLC
jgi:hypothetical protein